ncbi:unnamed protein product [Closterium sp. NIES-54]
MASDPGPSGQSPTTALGDAPRLTALDFLTWGASKLPPSTPVLSTAILEQDEPTKPAAPAALPQEWDHEPWSPQRELPRSPPPSSSGTPSVETNGPSSSSTNPVLPARRSGKAKYLQCKINFARPAALPARHATVTLEKPKSTPAKSSAEVPKVLTVEELQLKCKEQWQRYFPWLIIGEVEYSRPVMKCTTYLAYADPNSKYGRDGSGGYDIQKHTMRKHQHSIKHEAAVNQKERRDAKLTAQNTLEQYETTDEPARRLIRLLANAHYICKSDAPIVMFVSLVQFMAEQGTLDMPLREIGMYYSEYGFAQMVETLVTYLRAKQMEHIRTSPFLGIQLDESTDRRWGKHMIVYLTFLWEGAVTTEFFAHLTVDKGDAGSLIVTLLTHLESSGVDLYRISGISTDGASVMTGDKNGLDARLRTKIPLLVSCHCIAHREALFAKDAATTVPDMQVVDKVIRSLAEDLGRSSNQHGRFKELQEVLCETNLELEGIHSVRWLSRGAAIHQLVESLPAAIIFFMDWRYKDLASLSSSKLFKQSHYLRSPNKRQRKCLAWLQMLRDMFKRKPGLPDTLPVNWAKAQRELKNFTTILSTHHNNLEFQEGLKQMLSTPDWTHAYPNLVNLWIVIAILPLSTVKCECGFSRQNIIKSWLCGNLCDTKLSGLMTVSLLKYDLDLPELIRLWRCNKKRRPAKEVVMAAGSRPVKRSKKEMKALAKAAADVATAAKESARVEAEEGGWQSRGKTKASAPLDLDNPFDEEDTVDSSSSSSSNSDSSDSE